MQNKLTQVRLGAFFCLLGILTPTTSAYATVILVVVKPDAIWVGTDAMRSGNGVWENVCKAHEAYGGILLKSGADQDHDRTFSSDSDIKHLLETKKSFSEFKSAAADILQQRVDHETKETFLHNRDRNPNEYYDDSFPFVLKERDAFGINMFLA